MSKPELSWDLLRTLLEVLRDGSLSGAARRRGLTQPTAGRHIEMLEQELGRTLFLRSRRGLEPTVAALELLPHLEAMEASQRAFSRSISGDAGDLRGSVRVTASEIISTEVLPPVFAELSTAHPGLIIELVPSKRVENLLRRDCDVAVRMLKPDQDAIVTRYVGRTRIGLYAHRAYAERHGVPSTIGELRHHRLIGFDRDDTSFRGAAKSLGLNLPDQFSFRCDSDVAQLAALRAGVGIGGCQVAIALRYPDLVAVLPHKISFELEIWLAMHEKLVATRRVRTVFDALLDGLKSYLASARRASL